MFTETLPTTYEKPDSYFDSYEQEYRIVSNIAAVRLARRIVESDVIVPPNTKTLDDFMYRVCVMLVRNPLAITQYAQKAIRNSDKNILVLEALDIMGITIRNKTGELSVNDEFILAAEIETKANDTAEDIQKTADLLRHDQNIDFYVGHYFEKIEESFKNGISFNSGIRETMQNILFYIGHDDPRAD
jgi:hypothetical protein